MPQRKGGPFVLSEHGVIVRNRRRKVAYQPSSLLEWLTPVERPSFTIRSLATDGRSSFLRAMMGMLRSHTTSKLVIQAIYSTFCVAVFRWILCCMQDQIYGLGPTSNGTLKYRKGCPACEHSNPELERELQAFAQLLLDIHLAKRETKRQPCAGNGIDNTS
jgi:hypothetical protein